MKITLVLLFVIAFAALMQVSESDADKSSTSTSSSLAERNAKSSSLIRRKRWGWFWNAWNWVKSTVNVVVRVFTPVVDKAARFVSDVAAGVAEAVAPHIQLILDSSIIVKTANVIAGVVKHYIGITNTRPEIDDPEFNVVIIAEAINSNQNDTNPIKVEIEKNHPELKDTVQFSKDGFKCNDTFCHTYGDGMHAFGVCTRYACECGVNGAEQRMCEEHSVYDPVYRSCDYPERVKICGLS